MLESSFYLSIGGLIIKITVLPHQQLHYSEMFIAQCLVYFKKFFLNKQARPEKIDFEIIVEDRINLYQNKRENFFQTLIFKKISENKIITYTHISYIHFDFIFMQLVYELISKNEGFVFHCSAVKKDGGVVVFTAEDGGGKSTAMLLVKDNFMPVSDDTGIIRKIDQEYLFFPSPFRSANFNQLTIENKGYPIEKIFILKKAPFFKAERVKRIKINSLLINALRFNNKSSKKTMKNFFRFLKEFDNFYFLSFKKEKRGLIRLLNRVS